MTKASENKFPKVILEEVATDGSDTSNPAADHRALFLGEDGSLHLRDSSGTVSAVGGGYAPGGTDVAVADGGTGASSAATARSNLGISAANTPITDSGGYYTGTDVEAALQEIGAGGIGGGGGGDPFDGKPYIWTPPGSAHATDDEFNDGSGMSGPTNGLDAKWTKRNMGTSTWLKLDDAVAPGCAFFDIPTGQSSSQGIYQTVPAGDWTYAANLALHQTTDRQYWGIFCVSTAGTGVIAVMDPGADSANGVRALTTWGDGGAGTFHSGPQAWNGDLTSVNKQPGVPVTISLRKASGVYHMGFSYGHRLLPGNYTEVAYTPTSFTPAYIGVGRMSGSGVSKVTLDFFRKVA